MKRMAIRKPLPSPQKSRYHGKRMSAREFLALPEEKPYLEYIDGVVEQKPMVNANHGRTVARLDYKFIVYAEGHGGDYGPERRTGPTSVGNYLLPDTGFWLAGTPSGDDTVPTIAVEVRSPNQSLTNAREVLWLPEDGSAALADDPDKEGVFEPGHPRPAPGETRSAAPDSHRSRLVVQPATVVRFVRCRSILWDFRRDRQGDGAPFAAMYDTTPPQGDHTPSRPNCRCANGDQRVSYRHARGPRFNSRCSRRQRRLLRSMATVTNETSTQLMLRSTPQGWLAWDGSSPRLVQRESCAPRVADSTSRSIVATPAHVADFWRQNSANRERDLP